MGDTASYIQGNEGRRLKLYKDTRNLNTIGTGINVSDPTMAKLVPLEVRTGQRAMTMAENNDSFNKALTIATNDAMNFVGPDTYKVIHPVAQQVVTDMSYNMGGPKLNQFRKLRLALQSGNYIEAANQIVDSDYYRAKDTHNRAQRNVDLLLSIGRQQNGMQR